MAQPDAFLNVTSSATCRRWNDLSAEQERMALAISQTAGLPDILGRLLARRGVEPAEAAAWLEPSLRDLMPDPSVLRDMDIAAGRIAMALQNGERIAIFADYDVDGGASAALLVRWLRQMNTTATFYVPDRIEEGYGPNVPAMRALGQEHDLIICVDCGTLSHEPVAAAGCDVLVIDHHQGGETLPPALAVVNPNRQDESGDLSHLCAAGVVFLLLAALNRLLRAGGVTGPDLLSMLDLVALATVADVAPLTGLNRAFVRQGLKVMARRAHPGIAALADAAGAKGPASAYHLGFVLGPRINAGGRIGAADLGARLLCTSDPNEAAALSERLQHLNSERREVESAVLKQARTQAEARGTDGPLVWAAGEGWHPGVVGIVAARLKEAFGRPAVVIGLDGGTGKASARSVSGVDLGSAVARLEREGLIERGGGHKMAAGLSLSAGQIEPAMARLGGLLASQGAGTVGPRAFDIDGLVTPAAATPDLADQIASAGPFGAGNPAPRIALAGVRIAHARPVGESHLSLSLTDAGGGRLDAIAFRAFEGPLGEMLAARSGAPVHLAGRLERDDWQGRSRAKLFLEDAAEPN